MTVFKGYMLLIKRNLNMLFLYSVIFIIITLIIQSALGSSQKTGYAPVKLKVAVVDHDGGVLAKGLTKMLEQKHQIVDISEKKSVLQEAMFNGNVNYIVTIPEDFVQSAIVEGREVTVTKRPGEYASAYADQQISQFLNQVKLYRTSGYDTDESVNKVLAQMEKKADIEMLDIGGTDGAMPDYAFMFQFFPYLYLAVICYCMGAIIVIFKNRNIRRRMLCSSVSLNRQNIQSVLAYALMGVVFWLLTMIMPIILYRGKYLSEPNIGYYVLNSFVLLFVSVGIAMVAGAVARNAVILSPIVNVISLGMCFTCGVFVSVNIMSESVLRVAQFLPVYWYVNNNTMIGSFRELTASMKTEYFKGIVIQAVYAVALVCIAMVIMKSKTRAEK